MSQQVLFISHDSHVPQATISATSTKPASGTVRPLITSRVGTGRVEITGAYTGAHDDTLEILVSSDTATAPRTTTPLFAGQGSGSMADVSADPGAVAQKITVSISDLGTKTTKSVLDFFGVKLRAKQTGVVGNSIRLDVEDNTTITDTLYSTIEDIAKGSQSFVGAAYNWGALSLLGDGTVNPQSMRFRFGTDPTVYIAYSVFESGEMTYKVEPPVVSNVPKGTPIRRVSGTYTVVMRDSTITETYTGVVSLYDFLSAVKARSNLVEVDGVVVDDRTPGGMAVDEFPLRTSSYALPSYSSSEETKGGLENVVVYPTCPGQLVEVKCVDDAVNGGELWSVNCPSQGGIQTAKATTGTTYTLTDSFEFMIPRRGLEEDGKNIPKILLKDITLVARNSDDPPPQLCAKVPTCGIKATPMTITCVWTKRPPNDCDCSDVQYEGKLRTNCIGIETDGGDMGDIDPALKARVVQLYSWRKGFIAGNARLLAGVGLQSSTEDMALADAITETYVSAVQEIYADAAALDAWDLSFAAMQTEVSGLSGFAPDSNIQPLTYGAEYATGTIFVPPVHLWTGHKYIIVVAQKDTWGFAQYLGDPPAYPTDGSTVVVDTPTGVSTNRIEIQDYGVLAAGDLVITRDNGAIKSTVSAFIRKYAAQMDYIRTLAGIIPKSKTSSSSMAGDCWSDPGDPYYFTVNGLSYMPAFINRVYHSCRGDANGVVPTEEFAFAITAAEECIPRLREGDTVVFEITGEGSNLKTHKIDDIYYIPIIGASSAYLAGGVDGNDTITLAVKGSVSGVMAPLTMTGTQSSLYSDGGVHFKVSKGSIDYGLNDYWTFSVEGGTYKYRFGDAQWSDESPIPTGTVALSNGLTATFRSGSGASFAVNDTFRFDVKQPYSVDNIRKPSYQSYSWTGNGTVIDIDFGISKTVNAFGIANHTLPSTAYVLVELYDSIGARVRQKALQWSRFSIVDLFGYLEVKSARITVSNCSASIGWVFCGTETTFDYECSTLKINRVYSSGFEPGVSGEMEWAGAHGWSDSTWGRMITRLDWLKAHYDEPYVLVPNRSITDEAYLVRTDIDTISFSEKNQFSIAKREKRRVNATIPFEPVYT